MQFPTLPQTPDYSEQRYRCCTHCNQTGACDDITRAFGHYEPCPQCRKGQLLR